MVEQLAGVEGKNMEGKESTKGHRGRKGTYYGSVTLKERNPQRVKRKERTLCMLGRCAALLIRSIQLPSFSLCRRIFPSTFFFLFFSFTLVVSVGSKAEKDRNKIAFFLSSSTSSSPGTENWLTRFMWELDTQNSEIFCLKFSSRRHDHA